MSTMNSQVYNLAQEVKSSSQIRTYYHVLTGFLVVFCMFFGAMQNLASAKEGIMHVANSPETAMPLVKGAKAPNTPLTSVDGTTTTVMDVLNKQAAVLIFYRGSW